MSLGNTVVFSRVSYKHSQSSLESVSTSVSGLEISNDVYGRALSRGTIVIHVEGLESSSNFREPIVTHAKEFESNS